MSSIDKRRAAGQMTAADEAHHVRLMGFALDRANPKAKEMFKPAAIDAVKHYEQAKKCPRCGGLNLVSRALADSDDRIYAKWQSCLCGYDTRDCPPEQATAENG